MSPIESLQFYIPYETLLIAKGHYEGGRHVKAWYLRRSSYCISVSTCAVKAVSTAVTTKGLL